MAYLIKYSSEVEEEFWAKYVKETVNKNSFQTSLKKWMVKDKLTMKNSPRMIKTEKPKKRKQSDLMNWLNGVGSRLMILLA